MSLPAESDRPPVWARKGVATDECPKSYITADSMVLVEDYFVRRRLGGLDFSQLSAREVEAFLVLERARAAEMNDDQHDTRRNR